MYSKKKKCLPAFSKCMLWGAHMWIHKYSKDCPLRCSPIKQISFYSFSPTETASPVYGEQNCNAFPPCCTVTWTPLSPCNLSTAAIRIPGIHSFSAWDQIKSHDNKTQTGTLESSTVSLSSFHYHYYLYLYFKWLYKLTSLKEKTQCKDSNIKQYLVLRIQMKLGLKSQLWIFLLELHILFYCKDDWLYI